MTKRRLLTRVFVGLLLVFAVLAAILAAVLYTPDLPRETLVAKYGSPASQFVAVPDGATVHLRDQGPREAPVLVLLHGSNASLHTWEPLVAALPDRRIISLDLPGHGLTGPVPGAPYSHHAMAEFTLKLLDQMGLERFALAGNSMGGGVALALAAKAPTRVTQLILVDSSGARLRKGEGRRTDRPLAFRLAGNPVFAVVAQKFTPRFLASQGLEKSFSDQRYVTEAMIDRYHDLARYPCSRKATMQRFAAYVTDGPPIFDFDRITAPTLVIWGEEDHLIPVESVAFFEQRLPVTDRLVLPGVGHLPQEEAVQAVAKAIDRFLATPTAP